jgi:transketolase
MNMDLDNKIATRESFGKALVELGKENENVVVLTADLAGATKTSLFEKEFPDRFINVGIAEQNMIGISAGLATTGKIPFASTFAMFAAGRAYDQIRNSVAYPKLNVKICGTHAGVTVGEDGATHQMLEDLSLMRSIPNMTVLCTSDDVQTRWAIKEMAKIDGPVYIRLARVATPVIYNENQKFEIGKMVQIGDGTDATVFATGVEVAEALKAKEELEKENINIRVVDVHTIKPIDREMIIKCARETKKLITIEDHSIIGGLGTAVCEVLSEECPTKVVRMGMQDRFGKSGKAEQLLKYFKLDSEAIIEKVKE